MILLESFTRMFTLNDETLNQIRFSTLAAKLYWKLHFSMVSLISHIQFVNIDRINPSTLQPLLRLKNNAIDHFFFSLQFVKTVFLLFFFCKNDNTMLKEAKDKTSFSHPVTKYIKSFIRRRSMYKLDVHKIFIMYTAIKSNHLDCILKAMSSCSLNRLLPQTRLRSLSSQNVFNTSDAYANSDPDAVADANYQMRYTDQY